ncbi:MAG: RDD family protein, partial [Bdellovibrionales bacterium]|nr:RDD family protein [Bdellovibrionales bacterium]
MRCPACKFVCSDLRDICPKCLLDLRQHKRSLGLKITNPSATYDDLTHKISKTGELKEKRAHANSESAKSSRTWLNIFFRKDRTSKEVPDVKSKPSSIQQPLSIPKVAQQAKQRTPTAPLTTAVTPSEIIQGLIFDQPDPAQKETPRFDSSPSSETVFAELNKIETRDKELSNLFPPIDTALENREEESVEASHEVGEQQEQEKEELKEKEQVPSEVLPTLEQFPTDRSSAMETMPHSIQRESPPILSEAPDTFSKAPSPPLPDVDFNLLFREAWNEITLSNFETAAELYTEQFMTPQSAEEIRVLFDLSEESIIEPSKAQQYQESISQSADRQVSAERLQKHLERVEQHTSAPQITLKGKKGSSSLAQNETLRGNIVVLKSASTRPRLAAFTIDVATVLLLSILIVLFQAFWGQTGLWNKLGDPSELERLDLILPAALGLISIIILSVLYPLLSLISLGKTLGMDICEIRILNGDGRNLELDNLLVRVLTFHLSLLTFGYIELLFG